MSWVLAVLSGLLLVGAFPRIDMPILACFAPAPLLAACGREPRARRRFLFGCTAGFLYWFGVCYWIQYVLAEHGGVGEAGAWALFLLFCFTKALHMGVFAWLAGGLLAGWWAVPAVAALWVAVEVTHGPLGFAWLALGNAGTSMTMPLRLAPYTGVYGLSFVFVMMATALALALLRRPRQHLAWLLALPFLVFLPALPEAVRGRESAILVQPNIPETQDWTLETVDRMHRRLVQLSLGAVQAAGGGLIVWPEVPAPLYYQEDARFRGYVEELARQAQSWLLLGVVAHTPEGRPLNSAALVSPEGRLVTRYDKMNLVPFGEFVPWPFGAITKKVSTEAGEFAPGTRMVVSTVGEHKLGTFICYESAFPDFVRRFVHEGAGVLFNISNDGYFGDTAAREQHLKLVRMRAVENHRWILRATNDGITATIDSAGRVRSVLPGFTEVASHTAFNYRREQTLYTRHGDWFPLLCAMACSAVFIGQAIGRRIARVR